MRSATNQRRSTRIACEVPVCIRTSGDTLAGTLLDASRSGARLRVPGGLLGVYRLAPLALVARRVAAVLGESFQVTLNPDRLGSLVSKTLRPVRIGQRDPALADVDLGCLLEPALSDLEASMLGLALPVLRPDGSEDTERLAPQEVVVRPSQASLPPASAAGRRRAHPQPRCPPRRRARSSQRRPPRPRRHRSPCAPALRAPAGARWSPWPA